MSHIVIRYQQRMPLFSTDGVEPYTPSQATFITNECLRKDNCDVLVPMPYQLKEFNIDFKFIQPNDIYEPQHITINLLDYDKRDRCFQYTGHIGTFHVHLSKGVHVFAIKSYDVFESIAMLLNSIIIADKTIIECIRMLNDLGIDVATSYSMEWQAMLTIITQDTIKALKY